MLVDKFVSDNLYDITENSSNFEIVDLPRNKRHRVNTLKSTKKELCLNVDV